MKSNPNLHLNRSKRMVEYDYSRPGRYYITQCTQNRAYLFGDVVNKEMYLSVCGRIVKQELLKLPEYHCRIVLHEWVIMPDHVHAIIELGDYGYNNGVAVTAGQFHEIDLPKIVPQQPLTPEQYRLSRRNMLIPKIMGKFKMQTSKQINIARNTAGRKNWQTDYDDRIIRNDAEYQRIVEYIRNNPGAWFGKSILGQSSFGFAQEP